MPAKTRDLAAPTGEAVGGAGQGAAHENVAQIGFDDIGFVKQHCQTLSRLRLWQSREAHGGVWKFALFVHVPLGTR